MAQELGFPVAHGMTRAIADQVGAWWEGRRDHIQPAEFILSRNGRVVGATYSNLPVGRMDPEETLTLMRMLASRSR